MFVELPYYIQRYFINISVVLLKKKKGRLKNTNSSLSIRDLLKVRSALVFR
jgi:hypothetical protein